MATSVPYTQGFIQECNSQGLSNTQAAVLLELALEKNAAADEVFVTSGDALWDAAFLTGLEQEGLTTKQANVLMDYVLRFNNEEELVKAAAANEFPGNPEDNREWYEAWAVERKPFYANISLEKIAKSYFLDGADEDVINVHDRRTGPDDLQVGNNSYMSRAEWERRYGSRTPAELVSSYDQQGRYEWDRQKFIDRRHNEANKLIAKNKYYISDAFRDMGRGFSGTRLEGSSTDFWRGLKNIGTGLWNSTVELGRNIGRFSKGVWDEVTGREERRGKNNIFKPVHTAAERDLNNLYKNNPGLAERVRQRMRESGFISPELIKNGPNVVYDDPDIHNVATRRAAPVRPQPAQQPAARLQPKPAQPQPAQQPAQPVQPPPPPQPQQPKPVQPQPGA